MGFVILRDHCDLENASTKSVIQNLRAIAGETASNLCWATQRKTCKSEVRGL